MEIFAVLIGLFLVWRFMQNDIINIKMINIVTHEMKCFDHTLNVEALFSHSFKCHYDLIVTSPHRYGSSGLTFEGMKPR